MEKNSNLKRLANIAKQRMKNGNYSATTINMGSRPKASEYFLQNAISLKRSKVEAEFVIIDLDDEKFEHKVRSIMECDDLICNPIGKLVDKAYYNTLDEIQKQHYILSLCEKYNKVKQKYDLSLQKIS